MICERTGQGRGEGGERSRQRCHGNPQHVSEHFPARRLSAQSIYIQIDASKATDRTGLFLNELDDDRRQREMFFSFTF